MQRINFASWFTGAMVIIGGLNWGMVRFFQYDHLAKLFGDGSGVYRAIKGGTTCMTTTNPLI